MDHDAKLAHPLALVFGHLATPARLGDWLPDVVAVQAGPAPSAGIEEEFTLRLRRGDREIPGTGELIGYEPPWSAAYRLAAGSATYVLRLTCTASGHATRVSIRQAGQAAYLTVDLARLQQILASPGQAGGPG
jgi:hypothetical protein